MAKTTWNTGDIITQKKMDLIETKIEALLKTVNSLVGVVRGLENYINKTEESEVYGLDDDDKSKDDIGYNSPTPITINPEETALKSLIDNAIVQHINATWPDEATQNKIGNDGIAVGDIYAVSVSALQKYIDGYFEDNYKDTLETILTNIKNASDTYYNKYAEGDILITTKNHETPSEGKIQNDLTVEDTEGVINKYWIPFGQGRMLIGAGTGNDGENSITFPIAEEQLEGGKYTHTSAISATATKPGVNTIKVTNSTQSIKVATSLKAAPEITIKNETFDLLPPYIVVYFYKCCNKEEYYNYYKIPPEPEEAPEEPPQAIDGVPG